MTSLDIRQPVAKRVIADDGRVARECRRRRLERFASVLISTRTHARLFETMESYPRNKRLALRAPDSPLAIACDDAVLRRDGLRGDTVADAIEFFGLSMREAHALLCDCGYGASTEGYAQNVAIAARARRLAAKRSIGELVSRVMSWASSR